MFIQFLFEIGTLISFVFGERIIWRYTSQEGEGTVFSIRSPITLEHLESNQTIDWCHPQDCVMKSKIFSNATLECRKPGFHPIGPIADGLTNKSLRYIYVTNSPFYYEWYLAYNIPPESEDKKELRLWIMDPKHMSPAEKSRTAVLPSKYSKHLTKVFFKLGQKPFTEVKVGHRFVLSSPVIYNKTYNSEDCLWQIFMEPPVSYQLSVWIDGQSVALYDSFIRSSVTPLLLSKFSFSHSSNAHQYTLQGHHQHQPVIIKDPCAIHVAILISSRAFLTQNNFATTEELKVDATLLQQSEAVVKSVAFSAQSIVVLLESGKVIIYNGTTQSWSHSSGLPMEGFSGLSVQKQCFEGAEKKLMLQVVMGWTNQSESSKVFFSKDGGQSFHELVIPVNSFSTISVQHVELHCLFPSAFFLLKENSNVVEKIELLQYHFVENVWEMHDLSLPNSIEASTLSFSFLPSCSSSVVLWNSKFIAFGKLNRTAKALLVKNQSQLLDLSLSDNETIMSVLSAGRGDFVVHLSNNRMFYGKAHIQYLVEVFLGEKPSSDLTAMFDMLGSLLIVTVVGDKVNIRKFPVTNEVLSALYPHSTCPYMTFTTSINPKLHFMDKGVELKVLAQIMYPSTTSNGIKLETSDRDVLKFSAEDHIEHYQGIVVLNKTFTIEHELKNNTFLQTSPYRSTTIAVQLFPEVASPSCHDSLEVLHIHHGCPPSRRILIRNCTSENTDKIAFSLNMTGDVCHLDGVVDESFRLTVDMYDEGKFVTEILTDYMVIEETGRSDFGYTATVKECLIVLAQIKALIGDTLKLTAGCIREAQTWNKLQSGNDTFNIYRNCFEENGRKKAFDGSESYEVLNATGVSTLVFHGTGSFRFLLRVVDPHLSFCDLSSRFTVQVSGDTITRDFLPQLLSVLVVTVVGTVLLYINYLQYTKKTMNRHQEDQDEQQRLQELKSIFATLKKGQEASLGLSSRRQTGHNVRRFTGTAMLLTDQLPEEAEDDTATSETIPETAEPSSASLRPRTNMVTSETIPETAEPSSASLRLRTNMATSETIPETAEPSSTSLRPRTSGSNTETSE